MSLSADLVIIANELELAHWHVAALKVRAAAEQLAKMEEVSEGVKNQEVDDGDSTRSRAVPGA